MSMTLLTTQTFLSVGGGNDYLDKIRTFAATAGWTEEDYESSVAWTSQGGGEYAFDPGSENYLEISSTGYGTQSINYRFRSYNDESGSDNVTRGASITQGYITATSSHPGQQGMWNASEHRIMSMPDVTFNKAIFYGNSRFIVGIVEITPDTVFTWAIGCPEWYPEYQQTDGWVDLPYQRQPNTNSLYKWSSATAGSSFWNGFSHYPTTTGDVLYWQGAARSAGSTTQYYAVNYYINTSDSEAGTFSVPKGVVHVNGYSNKRTMIQPRIYLKDATSLKWAAAGEYPMAYVDMNGLASGDVLTYGAEEFTVYPFVKGSDNIGIAFRTL